MDGEDEGTNAATATEKPDTRRATFGGAAGALVAVLVFFSTALVVAHGAIPYWAFIPASFLLLTVAAVMVKVAFPRREVSERNV